MPTLEEALNETLSAEAVEASFVHAIAGIRTTENVYVSPRDGVAHSRTRFKMPEAAGPGADNRGESLASHDLLHTCAVGSDDWMTVDLPRPALGSLALLTLLYNAEIEQSVGVDSGLFEVEVLAFPGRALPVRLSVAGRFIFRRWRSPYIAAGKRRRSRWRFIQYRRGR